MINSKILFRLSGSIIVIFILLALLASFGWIANDVSIPNSQYIYSPPNMQFWFGTDFLGRSVLSRAIHGAKIALFVGFLSAFLATATGTLLGALSGYFGGWIDTVTVWLYSTLESIPYILLISGLAFALGQGLTQLCLALGLTGWVKLCRLIRGEFMKHRQLEYVQAAEALGVKRSQQIFKHILPNLYHLCFIQFNLSFILAIKLEVILSYLGFGVEPGTPSWGLMISDAKLELSRGVWWSLSAASFFFFTLILSVYIFTTHLQVRSQSHLR